MKLRIIVIGIVAVLIVGVIAYYFKINKAEPQSLLAVYKDEEIEIIKKDRLISLFEEFANSDESKLVNLNISDFQVDKITKNGLKVALTYVPKKDISVLGYISTVNKIYILEDKEAFMVIYLNGETSVLSLTREQMSKVYQCLKSG